MKRIKCLSMVALALVMVFAGTTVMAQKAERQKSPERIQKMETIKSNTAAMQTKVDAKKRTSTTNQPKTKPNGLSDEAKAELQAAKKQRSDAGQAPLKKAAVSNKALKPNNTRIKTVDRDARIQKMRAKIQQNNPQLKSNRTNRDFKQNPKLKPTRTKEDIIKKAKQKK